MTSFRLEMISRSEPSSESTILYSPFKFGTISSSASTWMPCPVAVEFDTPTSEYEE